MMNAKNIDQSRRRVVLSGMATGVGLLLTPLAGCGGGGSDATVGIGGMGITNPPLTGLAGLLPTDAAFRALTLIANSSGVRGNFVATLSAAPANLQLTTSGPATTVWAFNGISPGPLIDVMEGDTVSITFNNQLPQTSTIHWHGLPVPADQDGNPMSPVPSGNSKTYTFSLPIGSAGTYWYHPHPHETTHEQVFRGLAGCLIVRPAIDPLAGISERVMMVTDLRIDSNNQIALNTIQDMTFGREGDHLLINGIKMPRIAVQPGATERWRVLNATNARYLRLALAGHTLRVVGHDGGLIEQAQTVSEVLLAPAQRVELLIQASAVANQDFMLVAKSYRRGMTMPFSIETSLLTLSTTGAVTAPAVSIPAFLRAVPVMAAPVRTQSVVLGDSMGMGMGSGMGSGMGMPNQFLINNRTFDPARTDLVMPINEIQDWLISNQGGMDHPFHIHGTQFQLVASNRSDTNPVMSYRAWIDTINIRSGETVQIRIRQSMPGKRMFHCHILEHEDQGMMGVLDVQG